MIHFVGNVQSQYGRGKDKTKRKSRVNPLVGAGLGTIAGGPVGTIAGGLIAKSINKERDRFDKEGARTHLGKVVNDARVGAKSVGIGSAITAGLAGAALGSQLPTHRKKGFLGLSRDKKAEARDKLKNTLMGAGLGVLGGGVSGAINGAATGALVGAGRGFVQENKMKKKKKSNFNEYLETANFAFNLPGTKPEKKSRVGLKAGVVNGLLTGRVSGLAASTGAGVLADRLIDKEKTRFKKEGARSRLGKISNDSKVGAKSFGATGALQGAYLGFRGTQGNIKQKLGVGALSALSGGVSGAIGGAATGAGVGLVRGFRQPNKKKAKFNTYINSTNFEAPYYSTSKYDASKPYTSPSSNQVPKPKKSRLGKIGKKAFKFISKNPGKVGLGIAAGTIAAGVVNNQIRKSKAKNQNPLSRILK